MSESKEDIETGTVLVGWLLASLTILSGGISLVTKSMGWGMIFLGGVLLVFILVLIEEWGRSLRKKAKEKKNGDSGRT